ncbi:hypothetical protein, partial [Nesterenkonia flava]|uniref:hypothetical protein n=1 Tax=Nesterenkonia flava TaxID=469799 RepID=UPI0031DE0E92
SIAKSDTDRRRHHSADHKRYPKPGMSLTTTQTTASNSRYVPPTPLSSATTLSACECADSRPHSVEAA